MKAFAALSDPTRRQIVEMLSEGELSAGEISRRFAMTPPAISQHLRTLKAARLVRVRVDAQRRIYTLDAEGLAEVDAWLQRVRRLRGPKLGARSA